jgi:hypothetical protein
VACPIRQLQGYLESRKVKQEKSGKVGWVKKEEKKEKGKTRSGIGIVQK